MDLNTATITAKLNTPYGKEAHEATGFNIELVASGYPAPLKIAIGLPLAEAAVLVRQLAEGFAAYRTANASAFTKTIDSAMKEAVSAFE